MPVDDVGSLGRAIVVYKYIRQKCRFDLKSEGRKKDKKKILGSQCESDSVRKERCGGGKIKNLSGEAGEVGCAQK